MDIYLFLTFLLPFFGSIILFALPKRLGKNIIGSLAFLALAVSAIFALLAYSTVPVSITVPWIRSLGINVTFINDGLTSLLLLITTVISSITMLYSIGYFKDDKEFNANGFYSLVLLLVSGLIGVYISGNLLLFYIFWEMILIPSYAMVAYFGEDKERSGRIAMKYFIFTHVGAVLLLFGILLIYAATSTFDIIALKSVLPLLDLQLVKTIALLFICGFAVKMAIWPFSSWLPETYANAPFPATILLSAVMMNAPIYGFVRFFFTLLPRASIEPFVLMMMVFAIITQFYGAILAMSENNIKRIVAYSSISQMGYVLFGISSLTYLGVFGSTFHIINHAIIKALLFMSVGSVFFVYKKYDIKDLGGITSVLPFTALMGTVGALAIAGIPIFGAFQSEMLIFAGGFKSIYPYLSVLAIIGAVFTAAYALRFIAGIFFGEEKTKAAVRVPFLMTLSSAVLSLSILFVGIYPTLFFNIVKVAVRMLGV